MIRKHGVNLEVDILVQSFSAIQNSEHAAVAAHVLQLFQVGQAPLQ